MLRASASTGARDGALEAVRSLAHPVPGVAGQSPGDLGHGAGVRPGPDPSRWSPALPAAQQLAPSRPQSQGDQPETSDVPGKVMRTPLCPGLFRVSACLVGALNHFPCAFPHPVWTA